MRKQMARAQRRATDFKEIEAVCLPADDVDQFQKWLIENRLRANSKTISHWNKAKHLLKECALLPPDFHHNRLKILAYFTRKSLSLSYAKKVLSLVDAWGRFYCRRRELFYEPISRLNTLDGNDIEETYMDSERFIGASEPLTPVMLTKLREKLKLEQWKWLFVTVYFGLRPSEVNGKFRIEYNDDLSMDVLYVYQSKLRRLKRDERWKAIPAFMPEQREALTYLQAGGLKPPLVKTLKRYTGKHVTLYGGRKGFEALMLAAGRSFEELSNWLGHQSFDRTWRSYRQRKNVRFSKAG
jgi:hypothetical protein